VKHIYRDLNRNEFERIEALYSENRKNLEAYSELLMWWNKKINLVSRDVSRETIVNHIKHSLYISLSKAFLDGTHFLDTGSGGGLPGLPLSICFPEKKFIINDIVLKKIFSVNDMINKLKLSEKVIAKAGDIRNEEIDEETIVLTKHAFKIDQLYELIENKRWRKIIFLKGHNEAIQEFEKLQESNYLDIIKLDPTFMTSFYKGKGVVEFNRGKDE
jgi:16S rRNA (guanine527-N7)-methyltransferase